MFVEAVRASPKLTVAAVASCDISRGQGRRTVSPVVERYSYRAHAQTRKVREILATRALGKTRLIQPSFGFLMTIVENIRMKPELARGALMDGRGILSGQLRAHGGRYAARRMHASSRWSDSGVDLTTLGTLEFAGETPGQISCSFATAWHGTRSSPGTKASRA
jgi:predicted dehydrogenase